MADNSPPLGAEGLSRFDLLTVFCCAVELAEAAANLDPSEWSTVPVDIAGPASPRLECRMERHRRLRRILEEAERLKRSLGATGPLGYRGGETEGRPKWESFDQRFNNTSHDRIVRLALLKLATAAIDLSGFATWRQWQWHMRETGLRLLGWGLAQLWEGMSGDERSHVRERLPRTSKSIDWPANATTDPSRYDGPEEIPLPDQYRVISHYVTCYPGYLDDEQKVASKRVEQEQESFLRLATLAQFVETAERAEKALQAIANRDFDAPAEGDDLYSKAFWPLACLRRAYEIRPRETWPAAAFEQRNVLAEAAGVLLTWIGGTAEAEANLKPADADKALEQFMESIRQLRDVSEGQFIERLLAGPDDVELSPRDLAQLEAHLKKPVSLSREAQAEGKSRTVERRNKLKLIRDFNRNLAAKATNEAIEYHKERDTKAPTQSVLPVIRQCGAELEQSLNHATGTIRHAFFAVGGPSKPAVTKSLIDLTLGQWLGADKYDSLLLGPVRYPLRSDNLAELWHVFLVNGTVNRASMDQWCSTLTNLDRLTRNRAFSDRFADVLESEGWLLQLYRLAMRHLEWGLGELRGASLLENGGIIPAPVLRESDFFESWLIGQSVLPKGDHFLMLFDDIRSCSLRAVRRAESPIKSQLDSEKGIIGNRAQVDSRQNAEAANDSPRPKKPKRSTQPEPATGVRPPSKDSIACYRANLATGLKQTQLAERMTTELKRPISQGQVSRWIRQVEKWIAAGNVLPDLPKAKRRNPAALDPQVLELGERQDHRTPRQRDRRSEDSDD